GEPVPTGHPHVHAHDVGGQVAGEPHGRRAVAALADDLDAARELEDDAEPGPDHGLVVGQHDTDHGASVGPRPSAPARGDAVCCSSDSDTRHPPDGAGPASNAAPISWARSRIPARRNPRPGRRPSPSGREPTTEFSTSRTTADPARRGTTRADAPRAYSRTLASASWATR